MTQTHTRSALAACLVGTALSGCGEGPVSEGSAHVVEVFGTSTNVATLGLTNRVPGQPVLLLFSGAGAPLEFWGDWFSDLSSIAPVVAYDRPGNGESPFDGIDPTPRHVIEHAHALLEVLNVPPPYVLVGWSWGGPLIRFYAGEYGDDVVGMVYLDPTDMMASSMEVAGASSEAELRQIHAELDSVMGTRSMPPGRQAEQRVITRFNRSTVAARGLPDDPEVPTVVVLATQVPNISPDAPSYVSERWFEAMFDRRVRQFGEWARGRPNTTLIVAAESGHAVHRDAPDFALEAVRRVVEAVAANR